MTGVVLLDEQQQRVLWQAGVRKHNVQTPSASLPWQCQQSDVKTVIKNGSVDLLTSVAAVDGSSRRLCFANSSIVLLTSMTSVDGSARSPGGFASGSVDLLTSMAAVEGSTRRQCIPLLGSSSQSNFLSQSPKIPSPLDVESINGDQEMLEPWTFGDPHRASLDSETDEAQQSQDLSMKLIVVGVVVGFIIGMILQVAKASPIVVEWIQLPCTLFLRALSCVVVPYVFCSVAVAIGDIVYVGKISIVGFQTAKIFTIFWIATTIMGIAVALLFQPLFHTDMVDPVKAANAISFSCANGQLLTMLSNGTAACSTNRNQSVSLPTEAAFVVTDLNKVFATKPRRAVAPPLLNEMLRTTILHVIPTNLTTAFIKDELLSIVVCAMVLGAIAGRNYFNRTRRVNYLYVTLVQLRNAFFLMMEWNIALTPLALVSFIAGVLGSNLSAFNATHVYFYVLAALFASVLQMLVVLPAIVFVMTQCNPYHHMKQMMRVYVFAFACSSSIATAPLALSCLKRARVCSQSLSNFVISIGVCANASSMGFCVPLGVMFLAESAGTDNELTPLRLVGLFGLTLIACVATPPIPAAALTNVSIVYTVLFGVSELPSGYLSLVAVDVIVDRFATLCNVNDDLMAVKIIAETTDETVVHEQLGERP